MELHQVRYFVTLAQTLNFTRAAEQCLVSQPALTKAIQKLEHEFGGALVHRERQLTQLTELGRLVLPMLEETLAAADAARTHARRYGRREIAALHVGHSPSLSPALIAPALAEVATFIPELKIELLEMEPAPLLRGLLEGRLHAAIAGGLDEVPARVDRWVLFEEDYVVVSATPHPFADDAAPDADRLAALSWITHGEADPLCRLAPAIGAMTKIRHRASDLNHLQHLIAAGLGVGLVARHVPLLPGLEARPALRDLRHRVELLAMAGRRYSPALDAFVRIARMRHWHDIPEADAAAA